MDEAGSHLPKSKKADKKKDRKNDSRSYFFCSGVRKENGKNRKEPLKNERLVFLGFRETNRFNCQTVCKPGSVIDDHSSAAAVTERL